ncbi:hypothetical protein NQ314_010667 [Rhamnusium bicolor]|uniref:Uncharacterized protein n=1 Tax=Rhamnusium bicolor TaxID=1586634 RepID=A0AAV8XNG5_9CUCU|nr:hypothetical protein NQ314_010667 [Rhamnusium bicolor]
MRKQENKPPAETDTAKNPVTLNSESDSYSKSPFPLAGISREFGNPVQFRGLLKAAPRKSGRTPRRKGKSMIATDTPEKLEIERREAEKREKQMKKNAIAKKRKILQEPEDANVTSEENDHYSVQSEDEASFDEEQGETIIIPQSFTSLENLPGEGEHILIEFNSTKTKNRSLLCGKSIAD